jgi:hypothetical protein
LISLQIGFHKLIFSVAAQSTIKLIDLKEIHDTECYQGYKICGIIWVCAPEDAVFCSSGMSEKMADMSTKMMAMISLYYSTSPFHIFIL